MSDETPIILIGTDREDGAICVIGLYETEEKARQAVQGGGLPAAFYSLVTPKMNTYMEPRKLPIKDE